MLILFLAKIYMRSLRYRSVKCKVTARSPRLEVRENSLNQSKLLETSLFNIYLVCFTCKNNNLQFYGGLCAGLFLAWAQWHPGDLLLPRGCQTTSGAFCSRPQLPETELGSETITAEWPHSVLQDRVTDADPKILLPHTHSWAKKQQIMLNTLANSTRAVSVNNSKPFDCLWSQQKVSWGIIQHIITC